LLEGAQKAVGRFRPGGKSFRFSRPPTPPSTLPSNEKSSLQEINNVGSFHVNRFHRRFDHFLKNFLPAISGRLRQARPYEPIFSAAWRRLFTKISRKRRFFARSPRSSATLGADCKSDPSPVKGDPSDAPRESALAEACWTLGPHLCIGAGPEKGQETREKTQKCGRWSVAGGSFQASTPGRRHSSFGVRHRGPRGLSAGLRPH
jgi:hypothetical protein